MTEINSLQTAIVQAMDSLAAVKSDYYGGQFEQMMARKTLINTPSVLVSLASAEVSTSAGDGRVDFDCQFSLFCITRHINDVKQRNVDGQLLAQSVAQKVAFNRWGLTGLSVPEKITIKAINNRYFIDNALSVIAVNFRQTVRAGESIWDGAGVLPEEFVISNVPDVGFGHEPDYVPLSAYGS